jgi:hypothetical protein
LKTVGRFLAEEAPGLILQLVLMALFPPGVKIHNEKVSELSRAKFDPAIQDALAKQASTINQMLSAQHLSQSIYANVTARLDYSVDASSSGDLELYLKDVTFLDMKITNKDITLGDATFGQTGPRQVTKQITYSIPLFDPQYQKWAEEVEKAENKLLGPKGAEVLAQAYHGTDTIVDPGGWWLRHALEIQRWRAGETKREWLKLIGDEREKRRRERGSVEVIR